MTQTFIEKLASAMLAREGSAAIPLLRRLAARQGRLDTAGTLRRMAEAAERDCLSHFSDPYFETGF